MDEATQAVTGNEGHGEKASSEEPGVIHDMGVLDLSSAKEASELEYIKVIRNVGMVLVPEHLKAALSRASIHDVGAIVGIPQNAKLNLQMGQVRLSAEALAAGDADTSLFAVGQVVVTGKVESIGYRDIRVAGQLFAPRGSEAALGAKLSSVMGQVIYYPFSEDQDVRFVVGKERIGRAYLEALAHPTVIIVVGNVDFEEDIPADLLRQKLPTMVLVGNINAPRSLMPLISALVAEKIGNITAYPENARFLEGEDTLSKEYFEYLPEGTALVIGGVITIEDDVSPELLRAKVREIILNGKLKAPKPLAGLIRGLITEKNGELIGA